MKSKQDGQKRLDGYSRRWLVASFVLAATLGGATAAYSQQDPTRQKPIPQTSELGRANLSRVAASAEDIKNILVKDTGLMVELKRWVADTEKGD